MSNSSFPIESLYAPVDVDTLKLQSHMDLEKNRRLVKLGLAVMILDDRDRMLILEHEARDGEFGQRAIGPTMETFRYVPEYGDNKAEAPLLAWVRSLEEELPNNCFSSVQDRLSEADVYVARDSSIEFGEWSLGVDSRTNVELYASAVSLCLRSFNPDALLPNRRSEEVLGAAFQPIEKMLAAPNTRPGFTGWLRGMVDNFHSDNTKVLKIEYMHDLPLTGPDVRFD